MVRKRDVQSERTWLGIAVALLLGGAAMIAATDPPRLCDPFLYVGSGFCLLACWILAGVFVAPRLLPKLPSEKSAERRADALDGFLLEGQKLETRQVEDESAFVQLQADNNAWVERTSDWLSTEVSKAKAHNFLNPTGYMAADISGSFSPAHNNLRLRINARNAILRELLEL